MIVWGGTGWDGITQSGVGTPSRCLEWLDPRELLRECSGIALVLRAGWSVGYPWYNPCTSLIYPLYMRVAFGSLAASSGLRPASAVAGFAR